MQTKTYMDDDSRAVKLGYPMFSNLGRPDKIPVAVCHVTAERDHQARGKLILHFAWSPK